MEVFGKTRDTALYRKMSTYSTSLSSASHPPRGASGICMVRGAVPASVHGSEGQPQAPGACRARPLPARRTGSSLATPRTSGGLGRGPPPVLSPPCGPVSRICRGLPRRAGRVPERLLPRPVGTARGTALPPAWPLGPEAAGGGAGELTGLLARGHPRRFRGGLSLPSGHSLDGVLRCKHLHVDGVQLTCVSSGCSGPWGPASEPVP